MIEETELLMLRAKLQLIEESLRHHENEIVLLLDQREQVQERIEEIEARQEANKNDH